MLDSSELPKNTVFRDDACEQAYKFISAVLRQYFQPCVQKSSLSNVGNQAVSPTMKTPEVKSKTLSTVNISKVDKSGKSAKDNMFHILFAGSGQRIAPVYGNQRALFY